MTYEEALNYLENMTKFGINLGLERIKEILCRLGNPETHLKIIHVGGTNGKGSTVAMIASVLQATGYKVGTFTSPHLHHYTERYCINNCKIDEVTLISLVEKIKPILDQMVQEGFEHPTEFEVSTALALNYFWQEKADFVVLEVGMGGAIDSTNVVTPLISVITNVSMDHMAYLGDTVAEIAKVKAGIIKKNVPVVTASSNPVVLEIIKSVAEEKQAALTVVGEDIKWESHGSVGLSGQSLTIYGQQGVYPNLFIPLLGEHQQINGATALAALERILPQGKLSLEKIKSGLDQVQWPGRFEVLSGSPTVVLDGAHNLAGAQALRKTLQDNFSNKKIILVLGMLRDKEREKVIKTLAPLATGIVVTRPNNPRAKEWQEIAQWCQRYLQQVLVCEKIEKAIDEAVKMAKEEEVICITGSLYMIADARKYLLKLV